MRSDADAALAALDEAARASDSAPDDALLERLATMVRMAASQGASIDEIVTAGRLSADWTRSVLNVADEPLRDRLGRPLWIL